MQPGTSQGWMTAYSGLDERDRTVHGNGHDKRPVSEYGPGFFRREPGFYGNRYGDLPGTAVETVIYDEYHPDQEEIMEIVLDWFYRPRE